MSILSSDEKKKKFDTSFEILASSCIRDVGNYNEYLSFLEQIDSFFKGSKFTSFLNNVIEVFKVFDHRLRMQILSYLLIVKSTCLCELSQLFNIDPSTLTYHINIMKKTGIVKLKKTGKSKIVTLLPTFYLYVPPKILVELEELYRSLNL